MLRTPVDLLVGQGAKRVFDHDRGGTTTDIGQLLRGFPREANSVVEVGGVRSLFRMPDLLSIGLGAGALSRPIPFRSGRKASGTG